MSDLSKIANYIVLREQGKTYQEIGDMFGVSKQSVEESIKNAEERLNNGVRIRKNSVNIEKIVYKGIYDLFYKDRTMTVSKLARIVGHDKGTVKNLIEGTNARIAIKGIKRLTDFSGMTFEELFELRAKVSEHE